MKIVSENRFSGKTYFHTIASRLDEAEAEKAKAEEDGAASQKAASEMKAKSEGLEKKVGELAQQGGDPVQTNWLEKPFEIWLEKPFEIWLEIPCTYTM